MTVMRFDDDVVIVTGAGRGLGREHALQFAARGAAVVVNDVGVEPDGTGGSLAVAQAVVDEIAAAGGRAVADTNSVVTAEGARGVVATAITAFGGVTVLVNNAGTISFATLEHIDEIAWHQMLAITLDGTFQMSKAVWPIFVAQGQGRIVNTTSNAGFAGNAQLVHYATAKLGVAGFTRALAQEAGGTGITVNAVAPMAITRMNRDAFFSGATAQGDDWRADIASGAAPMGPPSAVSPTVLWLAHRTTRVNGDIYSSSSGKVARLGFVLGEGYFDPHHGPEALRDNLEKIRSLERSFEPRCTLDELDLIPALFRSRTTEVS